MCFFTNLLNLIRKNTLHIIAIIVIIVWNFPYVSGNNFIDRGDFSYFLQGYESIRITILDYHQFPWWNPWVSGGMPLYANPQIGVFSITTLMVMIFGTITGLKLTIIILMVAGYLCMLILLKRYFKVSNLIAVPLSIAWVLSSFFIAHLPGHFTFIWYTISPLFVYLSLTIKTAREGAVFGLVASVVALAAIHNAFFHLVFVSGLIILTRIVINLQTGRAMKPLLLSIAAALVSFIILSGHRIWHTYHNVVSFERHLQDPPVTVSYAIKAVVWPYTASDVLNHTGKYPTDVPFTWGELTSSIGIILTSIGLTCILYAVFIAIRYRNALTKNHFTFITSVMIIVATIILVLLLGVGDIGKFSPYSLLKQLPVYESMRVSTRWLMWCSLGLLILCGLLAQQLIKRGISAKTLSIIFFLGVTELFILNLGYQNIILKYSPIVSDRNVREYSFHQIDMFGKPMILQDGTTIPGDSQHSEFYREYEATTFNIGVIRANEPLLDNSAQSLRIVDDNGTPLISSNNAKIKEWSPNVLILERTGPGPITVNVNASNYMLINGKRLALKNPVNPHQSLIITDNRPLTKIQYSP